MSEIDELRARVADLERRVAVLFEQTGSAGWEAEPGEAPAVSDRVRALIEQGKPREAVKRYQEETGADMGEAMATLGQAAKRMRQG